jgi:hypothetical protein
MLMIGPYIFDAALSEDHTSEADVTEFPVEDGSTFTDNVRIKPFRYKVNGIVTDTPLDDGFRRKNDDGSTIVDTSTTPSSQGKIALDGIFAARQAVTVITALQTYVNMVMKSLTYAQDGETGDTLPFMAEFVQINIVENVRGFIKIKFTAVDLGNRAAHPPGWIGTDKLGRDIVATKPGPGLPTQYFRSDGTAVSPDEAAEATRKQGNVQTVFDKNGNAQLARPGSPYYAPQPTTPFPSVPNPLAP